MSIRDLFRDGTRRYLLLTVSLTFLAMGVSQAMYGPFYPHFRAHFQLSATAVGMMASLHFLGATVSVLVAGFVVRRVGFKPVILTGAVLYAAGFYGIAVNTVWTGILLSTLLLGVGFGVLVSYNLYVDDYFGVLGPAALNLVNVFFGVGSVLGPILAGVSLVTGSHRTGFLLGGAIATVILLMALRIPAHRAETETDRSGLGTALAGTGVFLLLLSLYVGAEATASNWIPTNLALTYNAPVVATVASMFWLALSAGRLVAVPMSIRVSPAAMVTGAVACAAASAFLARLSPIAPAAYIMTGFFLGPVFPGTVSWIRRVFPTRAARITSMVMSGGGLGGIFFPPLVGATVDLFSAAIIPVAIGAILLLCITTALGIARFFTLQQPRGG